MTRWAILIAGLVAAGPGQAQCLGFQCPPTALGVAASSRGAAEILAAATLDYNFADGTYRQTGVPACASFATCVTFTRAQTGVGMLTTNLVYASPSGFAYTTYAADVPRVVPGGGILIEGQSVNRLLNSAVPATQTTASLATGTYALWVNGTGSAQATAGTAVGTGFGGTPASQGAFKAFTITSAGTVTVTVTGSLNAFQLEVNTYPTSFILTAGAVGTRGSEVATVTSAPTIGSAYSFLCHGTPLFPVTVNQTLASISDGTTVNFVYCRRLITTGKLALQLTAGTLTDAGAGIVGGGSGKIALAANATTPEEAAAFNSGDLQSGAAALPPGLNTIKIGAQGNNNVPWFGYISRIAFWPTRLPNGELLEVVR
jgi:hypothetical protein